MSVNLTDNLILIYIPTYRFILPGTKIVSDGWKAYKQIEAIEDRNYTHAVVNHSIEFVNDTGDHTNSMEATWRVLKSGIPQKQTPRIIQDHLFERMWRSQNIGNTWEALMELLAQVEYTPGEDLLDVDVDE